MSEEGNDRPRNAYRLPGGSAFERREEGAFYAFPTMGRDFVLLENQRGGKIEVRNSKPVSELLEKGKTRDIHRISRRGAAWRANSRLSAQHLDKENVAFSQVVPEGRLALEALGSGYWYVCPERAEARN